MKELISTEKLTMSSLEIAELTGKRHDHVMNDIRKLLAELNVDAPELSGTYKTAQGNEYPCFNLPRRECDLLMMGYSVVMRAIVYDRWQELENQLSPSLPDFSNPAVAARAWAEQFEQRQVLESKVETLAPKGDFYDAVMGSDDLIDMGKVAKVLAIKGFGRNNLFKLLRELGVLRHNNEPYQEYIDRRWFKVVESKWQSSDGTVNITLKTMVYQKGLDGIRKLVEKQAEVV